MLLDGTQYFIKRFLTVKSDKLREKNPKIEETHCLNY